MRKVTLKGILAYSRAHESRTEEKFIKEYLLPVIAETGHSYESDMGNNFWVQVGDKQANPFLFVAHIDTCHIKEGILKTVEKGGHLYLHPSSAGFGCLGADDGVGLYCSLRMIQEGVEGTYLFTRGEEKGLIGATHIAVTEPERLSGYSLCIEVDRQGKDEIITEQMSGKCASTEFADALAVQLMMGHEPSPLGVYTDNSEFNTFIPECVNIAAGYWNQHTPSEHVEIAYVEEILHALLLTDFHSLPILREVTDLGEEVMQHNNGYYTFNEPAPVYATASTDALTMDMVLEMMESEPDKVAWFLLQIGADFQEIDSYWNKPDPEPF